jgi:hypothetical protein
MANQWFTSSLGLIARTLGEDSEHLATLGHRANHPAPRLPRPRYPVFTIPQAHAEAAYRLELGVIR